MICLALALASDTAAFVSVLITVTNSARSRLVAERALNYGLDLMSRKEGEREGGREKEGEREGGRERGREKEGEREGEGGRERGREGGREGRGREKEGEKEGGGERGREGKGREGGRECDIQYALTRSLSKWMGSRAI